MKYDDYKDHLKSLTKEEIEQIEHDAKMIILDDFELKGNVYTMYNEERDIEVKCTSKFIDAWKDRGFIIKGKEFIE